MRMLAWQQKMREKENRMEQSGEDGHRPGESATVAKLSTPPLRAPLSLHNSE